MGLFDFLKKKEAKPANERTKILLAMPMFHNNESYKLNDVVEHLKNYWGLSVSEINGDDQSAVFRIDGEMVALAYMPVQIPWGDIKNTAAYAYNWANAEKDLESHNAHALVSIMAGSKPVLERFRILSKLLCSILMTSNSVGILQGGESLLLPRDQYLDFADDLKEGKVPVLLWVYIGLRKSEIGNSAYTYGLTNFNKLEMEVINSPLDLEELHSLMANIAAYVIGNGVTFSSGETLGYTEDQKIRISQSKGNFVEGQSLKLQI
jgi:hypothetical protein